MRAKLSGNLTFRELVRQVRETSLGAFAHQDLPFEKLAEELQPERDLSRTPLFQVSFSLQSYHAGTLVLADLILTPIDIDTHTSKFEIALALAETEHGLSGVIQYNTDIFDASTIERMASNFTALLARLAEDADHPVLYRPMLTETEAQKILGEWNDKHTVGLLRFLFAKAPVERKPVYLDLNSPIYVNIFAKIIRRMKESNYANGLITTSEMLPDHNHTCLIDNEGQHYTSELRMVAVDLAG